MTGSCGIYIMCQMVVTLCAFQNLKLTTGYLFWFKLAKADKMRSIKTQRIPYLEDNVLPRDVIYFMAL